MTDAGNMVYPVTPETLHKYAEDIFSPIRRGESVTTVWVPMAGRRKHNKFIIENIELFQEQLPNFSRYLLIYIEPLDLTEESLAGYIRLMALSFIETVRMNTEANKFLSQDIELQFHDESASYSQLLNKLKDLVRKIADHNFDIVFFIGEFDELKFTTTVFCNNLKSLWSSLYPRLHYIFLLRERVTRKQNLSTWGELNEAILQNIVYVPILSDSDFEYMITRLSHEFEVVINEKDKEIIKTICGGHPYMLKVAARVLKNLKNEQEYDLQDTLLNYYELKTVAQGILDVRSEHEREILKKIVSSRKEIEFNETDADIITFLTGMSFIRITEEGYKFFSELFQRAVSGSGKSEEVETEENGILFDEATGAVVLGKRSIEEKFTRQEYSVLTLLLKNGEKLTTRDDIGNTLWGSESYEKYSDWAIDQLVSKLRKKLVHINSGKKLTTIRGKGYKLI